MIIPLANKLSRCVEMGEILKYFNKVIAVIIVCGVVALPPTLVIFLVLLVTDQWIEFSTIWVHVTLVLGLFTLILNSKPLAKVKWGIIKGLTTGAFLFLVCGVVCMPVTYFLWLAVHRGEIAPHEIWFRCTLISAVIWGTSDIVLGPILDLISSPIVRLVMWIRETLGI